MWRPTRRDMRPRSRIVEYECLGSRKYMGEYRSVVVALEAANVLTSERRYLLNRDLKLQGR